VARTREPNPGEWGHLSLAEIRARYARPDTGMDAPAVIAALAGDGRAGAADLARRAENRLERGRRLASRTSALLAFESALWASGVTRVAGVDEAGAGPLAGPVIAAAVILPPGCRIDGVDDSKRLSPAARTRLATVIRGSAVGIGMGRADPEEIDAVNIYHASLAAMARAVRALDPPAERLLVDARRVPGFDGPQQALIGGDARSLSIAAASILAKVERDAIMTALEVLHPGYGFASHKGYGTPFHLAALARLGPSPAHRKSFSPRALNAAQGRLFGSPECV
jgi:ribonuclease HII